MEATTTGENNSSTAGGDVEARVEHVRAADETAVAGGAVDEMSSMSCRPSAFRMTCWDPERMHLPAQQPRALMSLEVGHSRRRLLSQELRRILSGEQQSKKQ